MRNNEPNIFKKMSEFTRYNSIVIMGFMITELGLSGNDLVAYAIIYGATQDGKSEFSSLGYIDDVVGPFEKANEVLARLIELDMIEEKTYLVNGQVVKKYKPTKRS